MLWGRLSPCLDRLFETCGPIEQRDRGRDRRRTTAAYLLRWEFERGIFGPSFPDLRGERRAGAVPARE